jgi:hypothetical protein
MLPKDSGDQRRPYEIQKVAGAENPLIQRLITIAKNRN